MMDSSKSEHFGKLCTVQGLLIYETFAENWDNVEAFQVRPEDLVIATYPKSGTTCVSGIVDLIYKEGNVEQCKEDAIFNRIPFLECTNEEHFDGVKQLKDMSSLRIVKTYLPPEYLPVLFWEKNCKMIYLCRNVKDVAVSYYYFHIMVTAHPNPGTFPEFVEKFMDGLGYQKRSDKIDSFPGKEAIRGACEYDCESYFIPRDEEKSSYQLHNITKRIYGSQSVRLHEKGSNQHNVINVVDQCNVMWKRKVINVPEEHRAGELICP
ncbi:estrogen sulfotransferase [Trichechus manatus latirostris]|uniref:Sulfotransferase n=1 Tax=Trichechus manatus latirostris TaxID=127582 RepID=A0A2Y9FZ00_TRIMA|nr:estrogen sulfotransferase [Trichechus manatus latirostris]